MVREKYPYEILTLEDLPGEYWKPIPGFEDYYEISSYGRVKSLRRAYINRYGGERVLPEKIRKLKLTTNLNKKIGDLLYSLVITLSYEGQHYSYAVSRLVYHCFVEPFDLTDMDLRVSFKDGDGRNVDYRNLFITNRSALGLHAYESGRAESHLKVLSRPVSQFNGKGELLNQYVSIYEAAKQLGISGSAISAAASGDTFLYKGFVWQYGWRKTLRKDKLPRLAADAAPSAPEYNNEKWKDFPGYEGLYRLSNYGRVKALRKVSGAIYKRWYPERIMQVVFRSAPGEPGTGTGTGMVTLSKNRKKTSFAVARWVYHLFVKPFDIADRNWRIYYKDGDCHNLYYRNLMLKRAIWSFQGPE